MERRRLLEFCRNAMQNGGRCLEEESLNTEVVLQEIKRAKDGLLVLQDVYNLPPDDGQDIHNCLDALQGDIERDVAAKKQHLRFQAVRENPGRRGRPRVIITREQLQMFHEMGYSAPKMAHHFHCSPALVYRRLYEEGMHQRDKYAPLTSQELDNKVEHLHHMHQNTGSVMMSGFLEARNVKVQRHRVRSSLSRVDPASTVRRYAKIAKRRQYLVASPNSLWHIDGHMKLIRWGIVTHGGIDGYSRLIPYLACGDNNQASTVLRLFVPACVQYGVPSKVRSDHGGENVFVGLFMNLVNGIDTTSMITGKSVHNQRIERLWKDVFEQVIVEFYNLFYAMEDEGLLNINSDLHQYCLKFVFIPAINGKLTSFKLAWNKHKIRTAGNKSPEMLWLDGVLANLHSPSLAMRNVFEANPLTVTLTEALQEFNVSIEDFPEYGEVDSLLGAEQVHELQDAVGLYVDDRHKFCAGVEVLLRMNVFQ